jgi:hypothetical protein
MTDPKMAAEPRRSLLTAARAYSGDGCPRIFGQTGQDAPSKRQRQRARVPGLAQFEISIDLAAHPCRPGAGPESWQGARAVEDRSDNRGRHQGRHWRRGGASGRWPTRPAPAMERSSASRRNSRNRVGPPPTPPTCAAFGRAHPCIRSAGNSADLHPSDRR